MQSGSRHGARCSCWCRSLASTELGCPKGFGGNGHVLPLALHLQGGLGNLVLISLELGSVCVATSPEIWVSAHTEQPNVPGCTQSLTWTVFSGRTPEER